MEYLAFTTFQWCARANGKPFFCLPDKFIKIVIGILLFFIRQQFLDHFVISIDVPLDLFLDWLRELDAQIVTTNTTAAESIASGGNRNVYYIILDGYGSQRALSRYAQTDVSSFVKKYRSKGLGKPGEIHFCGNAISTREQHCSLLGTMLPPNYFR